MLMYEAGKVGKSSISSQVKLAALNWDWLILLFPLFSMQTVVAVNERATDPPPSLAPFRLEPALNYPRTTLIGF